MDDLERFKILLYEYLFNQECQFEYIVQSAQTQLRYYPTDSYYIIKYFEAVKQYEDFKKFQRHLYTLLNFRY